jgi:circadian clock protein KaiC
MAHSNQLREFVLTSHGVELKDVYLGAAGALTGSARLAQEALDAAERVRASQELDRLQAALRRKRARIELRIASLRDELAATKLESAISVDQDKKRVERDSADRRAMERSRHSDAVPRPAASNGQGAHQ